MALVKCENCDKLISDKSKKCPKCGKARRIKIKKNLFKKFTLKKIFVLISIILLFCITYFLVYNIFFKQTLEEVKDSVVKIEVYDKNNELYGTGSGFCAFESNYIVTNFHVIEGAYKIKIVKDDNKKFDVTNVLIFDAKNDLAILKTKTKLKPLKLASSKQIKTGSKVTAIGSPLGELNTVSEGIISNAKNKKGIQISAPISHGSSGGALFDKNYKLIGITYSGYDEAQNLNYAISVDYLKSLYEMYKSNRYYKITSKNYEECISDSNGFNGCINTGKKYFSVDSLQTLYNTTSRQAIYEDLITHSVRFNRQYNMMPNAEKEEAITTYFSLLEKDFCESNCNIVANVRNWDVLEFFINLKILTKHELAFVLADINNYSTDDDKFYRVEEYNISAAEKSLILYLIGERNWYDIHRDNKRDIFDYFDNKYYSTNELGAILSLLGYDVVYHNDDTLTAYWR